jgi:hypothetical protein
MEKDINDSIDKLAKKYEEVLRACYDALDEDVPQLTRDALRKSIADYLGE